MSKQFNNRGFTLLELSIVLVIIGLIIGGITVGADMIKSAELNSAVSDAQKYQTTINSFKLKYNALPGDMKNAEDYWGAANTDNGNADGRICCYGESRGGTDVPPEGPAWNHLSLAEMVGGSFSATFGDEMDGGIGPESSLSGSGAWIINYSGYPHAELWGITVGTSLYSRVIGQYLSIGADSANNYRLGVITAADAKSIDDKIDDGEPASGKFVAIKGYDGSAFQAGCTDQSPTVAATTAVAYDLSDTNTSCHPVFIIGK